MKFASSGAKQKQEMLNQMDLYVVNSYFIIQYNFSSLHLYSLTKYLW